MPKSYVETLKDIEDLNKKAEELRKKESLGVIEKMKHAIQVYGITAEDLGLTAGAVSASAKPVKASKAPSKAAKTSKPSKSSAEPKYRGAEGETWGGMGKRPDWLRAALASGRQLEEFLVSAAPAAVSSTPSEGAEGAVSAPAKKTATKRAKVKKTSASKKSAAPKVTYRDPASQRTWSGMGPRPKWLKEAEAQGQAVEQVPA